MRGLPGRRKRRRQHRWNPSRCQKSTVAGMTRTSASLHRGTTVATPARADGQIGESGHSNERGRATGGGGQGSRAAGRDASTARTGSQRLSGRRDASRVEWPATAPTSTNCFRTQYWRGTAHRQPRIRRERVFGRDTHEQSETIRRALDRDRQFWVSLRAIRSSTSSEGRDAFAPAANRTSASDSHGGRNIGEAQVSSCRESSDLITGAL
jgi:hypothetical protein